MSAPKSSDEAAFERAYAAMSSADRARLHDEARGLALREDPTLSETAMPLEALMRLYMRRVWEQRGRGPGR